MVKPGSNSYKSLNKWLPNLSIQTCQKIDSFEETEYLCYEWGKAGKINSTGEILDKIADSQDIFGLYEKMIVRKLPFLRSRNTRVGTFSPNNYAKLNLQDSWVNIKVLKLINFQPDNREPILMKCKQVETVNFLVTNSPRSV